MQDGLLVLGGGVIAVIAFVSLAAIFRCCGPRCIGYKKLDEESEADKARRLAEEVRLRKANEEAERLGIERQRADQAAAAAKAAVDVAKARGESTTEVISALATAEEKQAEAAALAAKAQAKAMEVYDQLRRETMARIKAYKAAERERNKPTDIDEELGTNHRAIKEPIPAFKLLTPTKDGDKRVASPTPRASARGPISQRKPTGLDVKEDGSEVAEVNNYAYAGKLLDDPSKGEVNNQGYASRLKARAFAWVTPRESSPKRAPASDRSRPGLITKGLSYRPRSPASMRGEDTSALIPAHADVFAGLNVQQPDQIRQALLERHARVIALFRALDQDGSGYITTYDFIKALRKYGMGAAPPAIGAVFKSMDKGSSGNIQYEDLQRLLTKSATAAPSLGPIAVKAVNNKPLRKGELNKRDANLFAGLVLTADGGETIPDQIRKALQQAHARVIDLFRQLDDDESGSVSAAEFVKAMGEFGMVADAEALTAIFKTFDPDGSGSIEYTELDALLRKSVVKHPKLTPLDERTHKKVLETKAPSTAPKKESTNMFADLTLQRGPNAPNLATQLRAALLERSAKVAELFRILDDDKNGVITCEEFVNAMCVYVDMPANHLSAVFQSLDADGSGAVEVAELQTVLSSSIDRTPVLTPLTTKAHNTAMLKKPAPPKKAPLKALPFKPPSAASMLQTLNSPPKSPSKSPSASPAKSRR